MVEPPVAQVRLVPVAQLQLARPLNGLDIDPGRGEPTYMVRPQLGIDDLEAPLTSLEAIPIERHHDAIFLIGAVKEGADVVTLAENAVGKRNRPTGGWAHGPLLPVSASTLGLPAEQGELTSPIYPPAARRHACQEDRARFCALRPAALCDERV